MLSPLTPFSRWVGAQPVIPEFYFDVKTEEQRYKRLSAILEELEKYVNYMVDAFNELYEEFEALKARVEELEQRMDEAEHRLDVLEKRLDAVEEGIRQFYEEFTAFVEKTEKHFDDVDSRLDALEGRMDSAEGRLDELEESVAKLRDEFDTFVNQTNEHLTTVDSRLDALEQATTDAQTELSALADAYKGFAVGDYLQLTESDEKEGFFKYTVEDAQMPMLDCAGGGKMPVGDSSWIPFLFADFESGKIADKSETRFDIPERCIEFDYTGKLTQADMRNGSWIPYSRGKLAAVDDDENYFDTVGLASKKMLDDITDAVDTADEAIEIAKVAAGGGVTRTEGTNGIATAIEDRDGVFWLVADGKELSDKADTAQAAADKAQETADEALSHRTKLSAETPLEVVENADDDYTVKLTDDFLSHLHMVEIDLEEVAIHINMGTGDTYTDKDFGTFEIPFARYNTELNCELVDDSESISDSGTLKVADGESIELRVEQMEEPTWCYLTLTIAQDVVPYGNFSLHATASARATHAVTDITAPAEKKSLFS